MEKKTYIKLSVILIVLATILRFAFALTYAVSGDACWHLSAAKFIATENKIPVFENIGRMQPFWPPPLFHFVSAFLYKLTAPISMNLADLSLKLASPIFGTLSVIILFFIARRLFDERIAFFSMIFINFVPLFLDYSIFSYTDSTTTFFSVLSVYLILKNKHLLSAVSLGLAIIAKYNGIFMYPMLLYLTYRLIKDKNERLKNLFIMAVVPLIISSAWFLRNWILLKNPIWPFLNGIFDGITRGASFNKIDFSFIFNLNAYIGPYLEFFGLPNGGLNSLSFYNGPFIYYLFSLWVIGTMIFIYPFIKGLFQNKSKEGNNYFMMSIKILLGSYLFMLFIYLANVGWFGSRLLLPILPFMAILWAKGMVSIKIKRFYLPLIILIGCGFIFSEGVKLTIAANEWGLYEEDFNWVKANTNKDDLFYGNGQCLHYNIDRFVVSPPAKIDFNEVDYIWVNNEWRIEYHMNQEILSSIDNSDNLKMVYDKTGTTIYKVVR